MLGSFAASIFTSCSLLRSLKLSGLSLGAVPPELGLLTALSRLDLSRSRFSNLLDSISQLGDLDVGERELQPPERFELSLPAGLTACGQLSRLVTGRDCPLLARLSSLRYLSVWKVPL